MIRFIVCNRRNSAGPQTGPDMHSHDFWQIDWVHAGSAELTCSGAHALTEDMIAVVAPGMRHSYRFSTRVTMSVVKFRPHFKFAVPGGIITQPLTAEMKDVLSPVFDAYAGTHRYREQIASHYLEIFLYKYIITSAAERDTLMEKAAAYMAEHKSDPMNDRMLAEMHGLSVNHFIKRFRLYFGTTPADHLRSVRMEAAKEMLLFRDRTMTEIARASGYADIASFSKVFKKMTGMAPSRFRSLSV